MYLDFYGFRENPFNVTSDPDFLYLSNTHREALSHLVYGINNRKGFIEITGEIGSGKTTLCKALISSLDDSVKLSLVFNSSLPNTQLLEAIADDFGIKPERRAKVAFIKAINSFLLDQLQNDRNCVLIIDEAQNLKNSTLETIRMLSNLETNKEKLLQIVLVGQPQLRDKLNLPSMLQLRQRVSVRFHLMPLEKTETLSYIRHRLNIAGGNDKLVFSDKAADRIFLYSEGIPRLVNLVCDKALLFGFVKETMFIDEGLVEQSIKEIEGTYPVMAV
ncbi:MAG: AAA family ATPase [Candidatus Omnitrophota bacterium]